MSRERPDLVLYNAGVDVHKDDVLGKMALTDAGILQRDRFVFASCADASVPVACAIGGGYQEDHLKIADRHVFLHKAAREASSEFGRIAELRRTQRGRTKVT